MSFFRFDFWLDRNRCVNFDQVTHASDALPVDFLPRWLIVIGEGIDRNNFSITDCLVVGNLFYNILILIDAWSPFFVLDEFYSLIAFFQVFVWMQILKKILSQRAFPEFIASRTESFFRETYQLKPVHDICLCQMKLFPSIIARLKVRKTQNIWWSHHVQWFSHLTRKLRSARCQSLSSFSWEIFVMRQLLRGKFVDGKFYFMLSSKKISSRFTFGRRFEANLFRIDHQAEIDVFTLHWAIEQLKYWPRPFAAGLFQQLCNKLSLIRVRWRFLFALFVQIGKVAKFNRQVLIEKKNVLRAWNFNLSQICVRRGLITIHRVINHVIQPTPSP